MKFKVLLLSLLALTAIFLVVQVGFAADANERQGAAESVNDDTGMSGMMNMMDNGNMNRMMNKMNSSETQKMVDSCNTFMNSYGNDIQKQSIELQRYSL